MLVELMGASGVGKSTVLEAFMNESSVKKNVSFTKDYKIHDLRFFCDFFGCEDFLNGSIAIISSSALPPTKKMAAIKILNETAIEYARGKLGRSLGGFDDIELKDELFLHRSYTVLLNSLDFEKNVKWYFENVPTPDAVVIFKASPDTILKRIKDRGKIVNTYLYCNDEDILKKLECSEKMYLVAEQELLKRNVKVFCLNAEKRVSESVKEICLILDFIKETS